MLSPPSMAALKWMFTITPVLGPPSSLHRTLDWTVGLDWGTGLTESCAHHFEAAHTLLRYSKLNITWTEFRADGHQSISISLGLDEVSAAIFARVHAIQVSVYLQWRKPNMHWPLSNSSTVNMHSCTPSLILSSKHSLPSGKSPHVYLP